MFLIQTKNSVTSALVCGEGGHYVQGSITAVVCIEQEKLIETIPEDSGFEWQQILKLRLFSARQ